MERKQELYNGKAKQVFATTDPDKVVIHFKDEATAGDGDKRGVIKGKGRINCEFTSIIYGLLEEKGVPTHMIEQLNETDLLCKNVDILPIEVIVRNRVAGGLAKRMGMEEGTPLKRTILEQDYKCDELHDPMVNIWHILAFEYATKEQYDKMNETAMKVNEILVPYFDEKDIILVDYKLEFGLSKGEILLADEFTPDGARLWDSKTMRKLDKDRFRRDMDGIEEAYAEALERVRG